MVLVAFGLEDLQLLHQRPRRHIQSDRIAGKIALAIFPRRECQAFADQVAPCRLHHGLRKGRDMHVELLQDVFRLCTAGSRRPIAFRLLGTSAPSAGPEVFSSDQGRSRPVSTMAGRFKALILQLSIRSVLNHRLSPTAPPSHAEFIGDSFGSATVSRCGSDADQSLAIKWRINPWTK